MKIKKTVDKKGSEDFEISLINDYQDLKFSLFLGEKSKDGWWPYYCSLSVLNSLSSNFKTLYATNSSSIATELSQDEIQNLLDFMENLLSKKNTNSRFVSETHEFTLNIENFEDIYKVTAIIDLFTMNETRLEAGHSDSDISLSFKCTREEIDTFARGLKSWYQK